MMNTATAHIDLSALQKNLSTVRQLCPHSRVMAVVKADAYGHGLVRVAQSLASADGLAVARLSEAVTLRNAGFTNRVLLLATLLDASDVATCGQLHIDVTVHDNISLRLVMKQAQHTPLRVWLKLDSGMHRVGLEPEEFIRADSLLSQHPGIDEMVHMTHFSDVCNPVTTERQLLCFHRIHEESPGARVSIANSAALIARADTHADWVRPGIMLYGDNPMSATHDVPLLPVMTLTAKVIAIRQIGVGESVGYNERWSSKRPSRIGTIGIGYGDGYPRHARNGTPVWIDGQIAPLVGQVSMDSLMVDLTDCDECTPGSDVILWGKELPAKEVANHAGTISYELFTSVQRRVPRLYQD
jgi:alanine racemase